MKMRIHPVLLLMVGLAATPAAAYVLPARHVVRNVNARLGRVHSLQVTLAGRARHGERPDAAIAVAERWIFQRGGREARVDVNGPNGRTATWSRSGESRGDAALLPSEAERLVFTRLFADGDLTALARDIGADPETVHLGLLGDRPAFVIGATDPRSDVPRIWVDQDEFTVLRVRYRDGRGRWVDLRATGWEGPPTRGLFPQRIRVVVGGRWVRVMEVEELRANRG